MKGQILQLTAYGLLLQEKYNLPCQIGFILYENSDALKSSKINFDPISVLHISGFLLSKIQ
jgi:hypothetical protein